MYKRQAPYYEQASLLLLASEYEGLPLVVVEGMSFGAVPLLYGCLLYTSERRSLPRIEALLFGTSGLLDTFRPDDYIRRLRDDFAYFYMFGAKTTR